LSSTGSSLGIEPDQAAKGFYKHDGCFISGTVFRKNGEV
jgi:hypothetical protein